LVGALAEWHSMVYNEGYRVDLGSKENNCKYGTIQPMEQFGY